HLRVLCEGIKGHVGDADQRGDEPQQQHHIDPGESAEDGHRQVSHRVTSVNRCLGPCGSAQMVPPRTIPLAPQYPVDAPRGLSVSLCQPTSDRTSMTSPASKPTASAILSFTEAATRWRAL